ncbi:hypothetical protein BSR28_08515 [Boudabousia liubingyangii]|uniref:ATP-dependent helicase C-terminal domain-containing protein n=1 Tax=Boudabousia liubingyangii TaxID=1921764 RepID=UPI00093CD1E9|nr:ATP-dependent helicase C-terminal domain-containing protein [Boudabousia liubingyangii]OKL46091.1 hypothetical protein BSR28_08515 [Boudabousia liubingyangii]
MTEFSASFSPDEGAGFLPDEGAGFLPAGGFTARVLRQAPHLPFRTGLGALLGLFGQDRRLVVCAPPGSGKTTLVPPALIDFVDAQNLGDKRIALVQPRRVTARAAARRLEELTGAPKGTFAYTIRGESTCNRSTRLEVMTPGVLVRKLLADPEAESYAGIIFDEVHERSLFSDLGLAFAIDLAQVLRPDLYVIAMSATLQATKVAQVLGSEPAEAEVPVAEAGQFEGVSIIPATTDQAPILDVPGQIFPLDQQYFPPPAQVPVLSAGPSGKVRPDRAYLQHVAQLVRKAYDSDPHAGNILVFLPGVPEIDQVSEHLAGLLPEATIWPLHGSLPAKEQDRVLSASEGRAIILSTDLAQSSLTVPGVRTVVDAGLQRRPRFDPALGVAELVTGWASAADCEQRAGRAARLGPGRAWRTFSEADYSRLVPQPKPEVESVSLDQFVLYLAAWNAALGEGLRWLSTLPAASLKQAQSNLKALGVLEADLSLTPIGTDLCRLSMEPNLGAALLRLQARFSTRTLAEAAAVLTVLDRPHQADLLGALPRLSATQRNEIKQFRGQFENQLKSLPTRPDIAPEPSPAHSQAPNFDLSDALMELAAFAFPRWVCAQRRQLPRVAGKDSKAAKSGASSKGGKTTAKATVGAATVGANGPETYLTVAGTAARLPAGSALASSPWLAVSGLRRIGGGQLEISAALAIPADLAREAAAAEQHAKRTQSLDEDGLKLSEQDFLGAIPLSQPRRLQASEDNIWAAVMEQLAELPASAWEWTTEARNYLSRLRFAAEHWPANQDFEILPGQLWPQLSDQDLQDHVEDLFGHRRAEIVRQTKLPRVLVADLQQVLPWQVVAALDEVAPPVFLPPAGSEVPISYPPEGPQASLKLQRCFGLAQTPLLAGGRVPLKLELLSPAGRPLAVTNDLASFWQGPYQGVRAEMRGRYPKHPWPEDPLQAQAVTGTKKEALRAQQKTEGNG